MEQHLTIKRAIRESNLNAVISAAVVLLLLVGVLAISAKTLFNHFAGPFEVTAEALISFQQPSDTFRTYVTTHPKASLDTGRYYYVKQKDGSEVVVHSYHALVFQQRLLLVKYPGLRTGDEYDPGPITGMIAKISDQEQENVIQSLTQEYPHLDGIFLPYLLDTVVNTTPARISIGGVALLLGLLIWRLINVARRSGSPANHPIARDLALFGDWEQMACEIDAQMAQPHQIFKEKFHLTSGWFILHDKSHFEAVPYRDMIWHYLFQINHRTFGVTMNKSYYVMIRDRFGKTRQFLFGNKPEPAQELLDHLRVLAPWTYSGYSDQLQHAWIKEREQLINSVDARRQAIEASPFNNPELTPSDSETPVS